MIHSNLTSNMLWESGPFCQYRVMDVWLIIIGFKTALTTRMKESVGYFSVSVEVYLWHRFSRGLESNQRLVSKVLWALALLHSSPAAAGYLEELSCGEERRSKSLCQSCDVWHGYISECNTEHKQSSCVLEVLLIYTKNCSSPQTSFTSADYTRVS